MGASKLKLYLDQFNLRLHHFPQFPFQYKKNQKEILSMRRKKTAHGDANIAA